MFNCHIWLVATSLKCRYRIFAVSQKVPLDSIVLDCKLHGGRGCVSLVSPWPHTKHRADTERALCNGCWTNGWGTNKSTNQGLTGYTARGSYTAPHWGRFLRENRMGWVLEDLNIILEPQCPHRGPQGHPSGLRPRKEVITHRWETCVLNIPAVTFCEVSLHRIWIKAPSEMPPVSVGLNWGGLINPWASVQSILSNWLRELSSCWLLPHPSQKVFPEAIEADLFLPKPQVYDVLRDRR